MIKIQYLKSQSGLDNCFKLVFPLRDYIPRIFFEQHEDGVGAELYFYICLLHKFDVFDCKSEHYHQAIWDTCYDCVYEKISFMMIYDKDYDMVSFSGEWDNDQKIKVANGIKELIETEGMNVELSFKVK